MKIKFPLRAIAVVGLASLGLLVAASAYAATPTFSLSGASGDSATISVSGDPNASVMFYYNVASASGMQTITLGTTNSSGYFSQTISASSYGINAGQSVYVVVNGQQSSMQTWPAPSGMPTLSQSSVTLGLGQSVSIYSTGSSAPVYMSTNSNPSVASIQTNSTQITVTASQTGSANASICYTGTANNCTNLSITVQAGSVLSFSQNNFTVAIGQGTTVTVTGGSGSYSVTSNSNPSIASAIMSGNSITVTGSTVGNTNVTACDTSGNCGTLDITVGSGSTNGSLYFSSSNPSLIIGQIVTNTISGGSGYYVTGNSNPNVASQSLNGNTLIISGLQNGTTNVTVCSASNGCGTIYVTVGGTTSGQISFGTTNPTITVGQSLNVSLSGSGSYYISSNPNSNIAQATVNGTTLTLYGNNVGSDSVTVCASGGSCNTLYVTVSQSASIQNTSQAALLAAIQSMQTQLAQLVAQIQTMATTLTQLANSASVAAPSSASTATNASSYNFTQFLNVGSQGAEVTALQQYLAAKGFYSGPITGFYASLTETAVGKYQTAHGIDPAGYVGPSTRAALNAGE